MPCATQAHAEVLARKGILRTGNLVGLEVCRCEQVLSQEALQECSCPTVQAIANAFHCRCQQPAGTIHPLCTDTAKSLVTLQLSSGCQAVTASTKLVHIGCGILMTGKT